MNRRRLLFGLVGIGIVAVTLGVVLPRIASYSSVWHAANRLSLTWIVALFALSALNVVTFALPWVSALPRLRYLNALQMTQASTAFTLVMPGGAPLGMGVSFAMLRSWGFASGEVARAVAVTGVWNQLSTFLFPTVAAVALAATGSRNATADAIAIAAAALFVAAVCVLAACVASTRALRSMTAAVDAVLAVTARLWRRRRDRWTDASAEQFRNETIATLRRSWPTLTVATLVNQLTAFALFDACTRAVGISSGQVSLVESFAAWSFARLLASLPLTPGGLGFVELGLTGLLVGFGGPNAQVVAAVLIYRLLSIVPTTLLGLLALTTWTRFDPRRRGSPWPG